MMNSIEVNRIEALHHYEMGRVILILDQDNQVKRRACKTEKLLPLTKQSFNTEGDRFYLILNKKEIRHYAIMREVSNVIFLLGAINGALAFIANGAGEELVYLKWILALVSTFLISYWATLTSRLSNLAFFSRNLKSNKE
jgi:hypothetical protein